MAHGCGSGPVAHDWRLDERLGGRVLRRHATLLFLYSAAAKFCGGGRRLRAAWQRAELSAVACAQAKGGKAKCAGAAREGCCYATPL